MGDRCYLEIKVRRSDMERAKQLLGGQDRGGELIADLVDEQANYGLFAEREGAAQKGLVFQGSHGSGDEYRDSRFCAWGGHQYSVETNMEGSFTISVDENGDPSQYELQDVRLFIQKEKLVWDYLHGLIDEKGSPLVAKPDAGFLDEKTG